MTVQQQIEGKLAAAFAPSHLEVENESHRHSVPAGSESHFRVVIVSERFDGQRRLARHQAVNRLLADELRNQIHALAIETHTAREWAAKGGIAAQSPECLGGSKSDT